MSDWDRDYPAPAKLNLFLHVVGRRADGYHLLQSAFRLIDLSDRLRFERRSDGLVRRASNIEGVAENEDLSVRAARLLQAEIGGRCGVSIHLEKRLPMGGGLGGGSSDAATVLVALNHLWGGGFSRERLQALGLRLGADVPFFIFGRNAFVEGIGEVLQPLSLAAGWYLVIAPGVAVATAEIFADPKLTRNTKAIKMADFSAAWGQNDLQAVVRERYSAVGEVLDWLGQYGQARMTGSGACVFAEFATEAQARRVAEKVPARWRGWVAKGLDRHPLHALSGE